MTIFEPNAVVGVSESSSSSVWEDNNEETFVFVLGEGCRGKCILFYICHNRFE